MSRPVKPIPLDGITPKPIARLPTFGWADPKTLSLFFVQKCRVPSHFRSPGYSDLMTIEQHSRARQIELGKSLAGRRKIYLDARFWIIMRDAALGICAELGISEAQYVEWLRVLFMLLVPMAEGQPNFFEDMIRRLLENRKMHVAALVHEYDSAHCLLSDRGFSQPIADGPHMAFSFNLCATAFVDYVFLDPATSLQGKAPPEFIARSIANCEGLPEKQIHVTFVRNNLEMLARFNHRAIEQCYRRIYC
jgi:hypothetical protein